MISTLDGTPAWVSYTFGGRASERDIMCGSDWAKFFKECTEKWKLKGKSGKAIPIICLMDKGTRMEKEVKKEGGKSLTPTQLKDNFVSLKDSARNEHVSKARGHVERAIGRVKRNRILAGAVHHSLLPLLDDIVFFCVFSTHLVAPKVETTRPSRLASWTRARTRAAGAVATSRWRTHRSRENGQ